MVPSAARWGALYVEGTLFWATAVLLSLVVGAGTASATVFTFEDLDPGVDEYGCPIEGTDSLSDPYRGFLWGTCYRSPYWVTKYYYPSLQYIVNTVQGRVGLVAYPHDPYCIKRLDGSSFEFSGALMGGQGPVVFRAYIGATLIDEVTVTLTQTPSWHGFDSDWHGIDCVQYVPYVAFAMDNVEVDRAETVPEPASLALLACAIGGIGAMLRKRRK